MVFLLVEKLVPLVVLNTVVVFVDLLVLMVVVREVAKTVFLDVLVLLVVFLLVLTVVLVPQKSILFHNHLIIF